MLDLNTSVLHFVCITTVVNVSLLYIVGDLAILSLSDSDNQLELFFLVQMCLILFNCSFPVMFAGNFHTWPATTGQHVCNVYSGAS